jgi:hypothetical protein
MSTKITVTIGKFERTYTLVETNAPPRYDGFGTFEVYDSEPNRRTPRDRSEADRSRFVLVDDKHLEWQQGRYGSGLYTYQVEENDLTTWVQEKLYKKLTANQGGDE